MSRRNKSTEETADNLSKEMEVDYVRAPTPKS